MENIYNAWTHFNKQQAQFFNGHHSSQWLESVQKNTENWKSSLYPSGENWKYVKFNQLPTTNLRISDSTKVNEQVADEACYSFEVKNFSASARLNTESLPTGLEVCTYLDEINSLEESPFLNLYKANQKENPFSQSVLSFAGAGLVLRISEEVQIDRPIKIIFDLNQVNKKDSLVMYSLLIDAKKSSRIQIFVEIRGENFVGLANLRTDVVVRDEAQVTLCHKEQGGDSSHILNNVEAQVFSRGLFRSFDFTLPSLWTRHNLKIDLKEKHAQTQIQGAYLNNKNFFSDHHTEVNHLVGETESKEDYRGILADTAKAVFNGKVFVAEGAAKSNSEQINKNLMLSKSAEINAKPELQIYNDDVKAAHGATVGQLDEEQRFYLQSRGYSNKQAMQVLSKAFIFDLIEGEGEELKQFYSSSLKQTLVDLKES